jgi:nitroreductase
MYVAHRGRLPLVKLNLTADEVLATTRSVRKRLDLERPVEREIVEECLELALQAPTGSNRQGWHWVVVEDAAKKKALADIYAENFNMYRSMPRPTYAEGDTRAERADFVVESADYLTQHFHEVPLMLIPCIEGRIDGAQGFVQASVWGSLLPAVWSFMLALPRARHGFCVDDHPPDERRRGEGRRTARHPERQGHAGRPVPGGVHAGHRLQARPSASRWRRCSTGTSGDHRPRRADHGLSAAVTPPGAGRSGRC